MSRYGSTDNINVTGIPLDELLVAMYHGTVAMGLGHLHHRSDFGLDDAREALDHSRKYAHQGRIRFDYVAGHPIKTSFVEHPNGSVEIASSVLYNRDAGHGALEEIVGRLREKYPVAP